MWIPHSMNLSSCQIKSRPLKGGRNRCVRVCVCVETRYQYSKQTYQIEIKFVSNIKKKKNAVTSQKRRSGKLPLAASTITVCGTLRPSIKRPPLTQEEEAEETNENNKMEKQNVNIHRAGTSNLSVEKFLRLFIYFRTLDFSTIASVSRLLAPTPAPPHTLLW